MSNSSGESYNDIEQIANLTWPNETTTVANLSNPYSQTYWIISEIILTIVTFLNVFLLYRLGRYSYPYFLLDMRGMYGKVFHYLCVTGFVVMLLALASAHVSAFLSWQSIEFCKAMVKSHIFFLTVCIQIFLYCFWIQQFYITWHPTIRTHYNDHIKAARRLVLVLVVLVFPSHVIIFVIGDYPTNLVNVTATGCKITRGGDPTLPILFWIYTLVTNAGIAGLFIPPYRTLKRKVAEDCGADIADGHEAKTFFMERATSYQMSIVRKRILLFKRIRRLSKLSVVPIVTATLYNILFINIPTYVQLVIMLSTIKATTDLIAVIVCLDQWKVMLFSDNKSSIFAGRGGQILSENQSLESIDKFDSNISQHLRLMGSIITFAEVQSSDDYNNTKQESLPKYKQTAR